MNRDILIKEITEQVEKVENTALIKVETLGDGRTVVIVTDVRIGVGQLYQLKSEMERAGILVSEPHYITKCVDCKKLYLDAGTMAIENKRVCLGCTSKRGVPYKNSFRVVSMSGKHLCFPCTYNEASDILHTNSFGDVSPKLEFIGTKEEMVSYITERDVHDIVQAHEYDDYTMIEKILIDGFKGTRNYTDAELESEFMTKLEEEV